MSTLLPIGRFSQVCRLTVKALRYYDELGLLTPALVDEQTGYRYYSLAQAADAERIRVLRALELPLDEIRAVLAERDPRAVRARLEGHARRLEARLAGYREALALLHRVIDTTEEPMTYDVRIATTSPQPIISIRAHTALADIGRLMGSAIGELFAYLGQIGARPVGPPLSIYHDEEFKEEDMDVEVAVPCDRRVAGQGRTNGRILDGGEVAVTMHPGPFDGISGAYRALAEWMKREGWEPAGPPRETYLVGGPQAPDPATWRTEVAWPIRRA